MGVRCIIFSINFLHNFSDLFTFYNSFCYQILYKVGLTLIHYNKKMIINLVVYLIKILTFIKVALLF